MPPQSHNNTAIWVIISIFALFLAGNFVFTQYEISQIKNNIIQETASAGERIPTIAPIIQTTVPTPTQIPTISPTPTLAASTKTDQIFMNNQITYIPLTGGSTQNTDWTAVQGSQFTLNISDYGTKAYAVWDANLRVDNANGTTFVRLYDTIHNIAVNGSQISIDNTSTSTDVISGGLQFWQGNNTYVVQIKSLNGSTAFVDSGRIKINY